MSTYLIFYLGSYLGPLEAEDAEEAADRASIIWDLDRDLITAVEPEEGI